VKAPHVTVRIRQQVEPPDWALIALVAALVAIVALGFCVAREFKQIAREYRTPGALTTDARPPLGGAILIEPETARQVFYIPGLTPSYVAQIEASHTVEREVRLDDGHRFRGRFLEPVYATGICGKDSLAVYPQSVFTDTVEAHWIAWPMPMRRARTR